VLHASAVVVVVVVVVVVSLKHRTRHALAPAEQDVRQSFQEVLRGDELAVVTQQHVERGDKLRLCQVRKASRRRGERLIR
jgi:uncharacterized protein YpmB